MSVDLKVPSIGESITEAFISRWMVNEGEYVEKDAPVVEMESDKANFELPSPVSGTLTHITKKAGDTVAIGEVIGQIAEGQGQAKPKSPGNDTRAKAKPAEARKEVAVTRTPPPVSGKQASSAEPHVMPAAARALHEQGLKAEQVQATGPGGRLLKQDVLQHSTTPQEQVPAQTEPSRIESKSKTPPPQRVVGEDGREEELVPMSPMRQTIARHLVEAQHNAALLTTFNEIDMSAVMTMRQRHRDAFEKKYGVGLGFMGFFVKAVVDALKLIPALNAEIRGNQIAYRNYQDIGIAVSTDRGLVVPVIRNAERLSFAEIEAAIGDFAGRARENKITLSELQGGTFTITNGGVFGSLLSTPIVNPPQSGVLGMHSIQQRPVAIDNQVVIRPMMYVALTYDHRIVDGKQAVTFLKRIKEVIEEPTRMLIEI